MPVPSQAGQPGLNFIIIGASIAGLASAIGLKRSGHNVLVLEKEELLGGDEWMSEGCARVPPNGCKILFDWGLEQKVREKGVIGEGFMVFKYNGGLGHSRDYIGRNRWDDPEFRSDARGEFILFRHKDLLQILYDAAIDKKNSASKVDVMFGAEIVRVDLDVCSVTTRSGQIHQGDVIIGADGARGIVRETLMREELGDPSATIDAYDIPTGISVYSTTIPKAVGVSDEDVASLWDYPQKTLGTVSIGDNRGALTCLAGKNDDMGFWVYTPEGSQDGSWTQKAEKKIDAILGECDTLFQKLAALGGSARCLQIKEPYELDSWVSESGRTILLGEAAHPFPPISMQSYSIALEDGAFIGKIFGHTRNRNRIPEFLNAFEEHRRNRCSLIRSFETRQIQQIILPDGEVRAQQEAVMRANQAAGRNVMDGPDIIEILEEMRLVFGYEPADDADEWWISWGRLREAPAAIGRNGNAMNHNGNGCSFTDNEQHEID